jgi:hypothetical protein
MSDWNRIETKWNADDDKFRIIMEIERELEIAFTTYDLSAIYTLLRSYRRQTNCKFNTNAQGKIEEEMVELSNLFNNYKKTKSEESRKQFYLSAENFFLNISQALKEAGVYFREGRDASTAILRR